MDNVIPEGVRPVPMRKLERVSQHKHQTYEAAREHRQRIIAADGPPPKKVKIFCRFDDTFDVVVYADIEEKAEKGSVASPAREGSDAPRVEKKAHGLKSKDRKRPHRNQKKKM